MRGKVHINHGLNISPYLVPTHFKTRLRLIVSSAFLNSVLVKSQHKRVKA